MVFDVGRLCVKTAGRDSGRYCVIVDSLPNNYVLVTGPKPLTGVRRRKCNIDHLRPLPHSVKLKKDSPDSDVLSAFEKDGVYKILKLEPMTEEKLKQWEAQRAEKAKAAASKPKVEKKIEAKKEIKTEEKKETKKAETVTEVKSETKETVSEKPKVKKAAKPKTETKE